MSLTRRRVVAVMAASALGSSGLRSDVQVVDRFRALGAEAKLTLIGDRDAAEIALYACRSEVAAIERVFSLWDPNSDLVRLNTIGHLDAPDFRFVELARRAQEMAAVTNGAFDPTVQVLWSAFARGESTSEMRHLVGWRGMSIDAAKITFAQAGMAATFNGIAQGYATDRVADVLARHGFRATLVNLGEFRALGPHPDRPWRIGVADPINEKLAATVEIQRGAVATSEPSGTLVAGQPHIFDPLQRHGSRWRSVTVLAPQAWRADALSTAVAASPQDEAEMLLQRGGAARAILIDENGIMRDWHSHAFTGDTTIG